MQLTEQQVWGLESGRSDGGQSDLMYGPAASTRTGWCQSHCRVLQPSRQHEKEGLGALLKLAHQRGSTCEPSWKKVRETGVWLNISLTLEDV